MLTKRWRFGWVVCALLALGAELPQPVLAQQYVIRELHIGDPVGENHAPMSFAPYVRIRINNAGQIAGAGAYDGGGFFLQPLQDGSYDFSNIERIFDGIGGVGLNDLGQVAGHGMDGPFLWENGESVVLGERWEFVPTDINDLGHIVSHYPAGLYVDGEFERFEFQDFNNSQGVGFAYAINNADQIVGNGCDYFGFGQSVSAIFLWDDGVRTPLVTYSSGVVPFGLPSDINDHGQAVGYIERGDTNGYPRDQAVIWQNGEMTFLPDPVSPIGYYPQAAAINNYGQIVGTFGPTWSYGSGAFLWRNINQPAVLLERLLPKVTSYSHSWQLLTADDINDYGEIVGIGVPYGENGRRGYLMSPDCNSNGLSDRIDIQGGVSQDVRSGRRGEVSGSDGIPDECQVLQAASGAGASRAGQSAEFEDDFDFDEEEVE